MFTENRITGPFPETAPVASAVFYRTYSRMLTDGRRESWDEVCDRTLRGLSELGKLTSEEESLIRRMQQSLITLPSGRWLWVGGTEWSKKPENFYGAYNCTSTNVVDWRSFGLMMDLAMQGCGTGAVLEPKYINQLPLIRNKLDVTIAGEIGATPASDRRSETEVTIDGNNVRIRVGDSRQGWVSSYQTLLELSTDDRFTGDVQVAFDLSDVRPSGEKLRGFGGTANPIKLPGLYARCATILNKAIGRKLNAVECCLLIDEAAVVVVAGNVRRCLPEDALVHTSEGLVPIKDVQIGDLVQTPIGFRRVTNKFDQGYQDVHEVETNATPFRATLSHRQAVMADARGGVKWKYVASLEEGDRLMHNTKVLQGTVTLLPPDFTGVRPSQSRTAKQVQIPDLSPAVAWLIGYTHGNGHVSLGRNKHNKPYGAVDWSMNALQVEQTAKIQSKIDFALSQFGLTATHGKIKGENTAKSVCSSIRLAEYFYEYIKQSNAPLVVPGFILQGTAEIRAAYLAGLMDSDGAVANRPPHLLTSVYPSFVRQVGAVLSSLGIAGRFSSTLPQKEGWRTRYHITLPALKGRYNTLIAPYSVKGQLREGQKAYGFTIAGSMMRELYAYSDMRQMGFSGNRAVDSNYERYISESGVDLDIPVTVKGLGSYDYVQTYDIEVEEAHCFYCDGYLTHNSAGMRQFHSEDALAMTAKDNLWIQDTEGNWRIDPERDALRMANHTRVFHRKPTIEECIEAVRKQFYSGEGAIQWAGEAERRAEGKGRYGINPCGEIIGSNFFCNLSEIHLNQIDPTDLKQQEDAFTAGAIAVASLLHHTFVDERYRKSREEDPIVGVSFTGLFDFFVRAFGVEWLRWWEAGRPGEWNPEGLTGDSDVVQRLQQIGEKLDFYYHPAYATVSEAFRKAEKEYLSFWKAVTHDAVWEYCDRHNLKRPNRCTTVQPAGCLTRDALRVFDQGLLFADEHMEQNAGECNLEGNNLTVREGVPVLSGVANDAMDLIRVTLENGRKLTMTPNHRLSINGEWVYASNMAVGQEIDFEIGAYKSADEAHLDYVGVQMGLTGRQPRGCLLPAAMSPALGYFIGALFGNGSFSEHRYRIRFSHGNIEILRRLSLIGFELFGLRGSMREDSRGGKYELTFANKQLYNWFLENGIHKPCKSKELDRIPQKLRMSSRRSLLAFFAGLIDTDGCIREKGSLSIDSASEDFIRHLQQIGEAIGLSFSLYENNRGENMQEAKSMYGICLSRMLSDLEAIAFINQYSTKAKYRPLAAAKRSFSFKPYKIAKIETGVVDYTYDYGVEGVDDNDSWYWQGALKSHNTKSLLTGASPGWHPPKAQRFIRRVTFRKNDPVALACMDYGYSIVPSQSDKDENGNLLNDPFDPRCTEWLVEIPVEVPWANLPGADEIEIEKFSALAQFDFYMQVQQHYTAHNTSATIELNEDEVEPLANAIYDAIANNQGYISAALLARFNAPFPRLPFEKIDRETFVKLQEEVRDRKKTDDFYVALVRYDSGEVVEAGPAGCDSDKCMMPERKP